MVNRTPSWQTLFQTVTFPLNSLIWTSETMNAACKYSPILAYSHAHHWNCNKITEPHPSHRRVYKGWVWGQTTDYNTSSNLVKMDLLRFSKFKVQYVRLTGRWFINHPSCEQRKPFSSNVNLNQLNFRTRKWRMKCLSWRSKPKELVKETIRFILSRMASWQVFRHSFNVKN